MCDLEAGSTVKKSEKISVFRNFLKSVFHVIYFGVNVFVSIVGVILVISISEEQQKDVNFDNMKKFVSLYLTNWNYMFQTTFLFLALAHDGLEWASKQDSKLGQRIRYWRDVIFAGLVVPYTLFVFCMFWTLYSIDRELVFPAVYDTVVPWWFNQCVHSNILAMVVLETLLQPRRYPADRRLEVAMNAAVGILYAVVYYSIFFLAGRWLYNVFGILTWWQVCLFQVLIWTSSYVFYEIQWPINRLIHGQEPEPQKEEQTVTDYHSNGAVNNGEMREICENGEEAKQNGEANKNGVQTTNIDFKTPPFSTKSWSLKYRTIRNQFENSKL